MADSRGDRRFETCFPSSSFSFYVVLVVIILVVGSVQSGEQEIKSEIPMADSRGNGRARTRDRQVSRPCSSAGLLPTHCCGKKNEKRERWMCQNERQKEKRNGRGKDQTYRRDGRARTEIAKFQDPVHLLGYFPPIAVVRMKLLSA